jgi:flagellar basal-body rod protein FlgB
MHIETRMSDQLARYIDLAAAETKVTAENMANIDTPGYRAVGFDFAGAMKQAMNSATLDEGAQPVHVRFEDGLVARPDGNNVSMDRESLNLAEAQLQYRTGVALLRIQNQMTMDAIHADSGK